MEHSPYSETKYHSFKKFPAFSEPEGSLPCTQQPTTGSYIEPHASSPRLLTLFP